MVIILTENVSEGLRGELTRWLLEVKAGVFVGNIPAGVRQKIWEHIKKDVQIGAATLLYSAQTEQGFAMEMHNEPRRKIVDVEGICLMAIDIEDGENELKLLGQLWKQPILWRIAQLV